MNLNTLTPNPTDDRTLSARADAAHCPVKWATGKPCANCTTCAGCSDPTNHPHAFDCTE